mgnify:CR=1 FL=1
MAVNGASHLTAFGVEFWRERVSLIFICPTSSFPPNRDCFRYVLNSYQAFLRLAIYEVCHRKICFVKCGRLARFDTQDLEKFIESNEVKESKFEFQ